MCNVSVFSKQMTDKLIARVDFPVLIIRSYKVFRNRKKINVQAYA